MKIRFQLSAMAAVSVLALGGAASAQRGGLDVTGDWTAQAAGAVGMQSCKITLTDKDWFGAFQASSFGCSGRLFGIGKWRVEGSEVVLLGVADQPAARLRSRGGALVGTDSGGKPLTLSRAGAPPRLPGGPPWNDRPGQGQAGGWDRDCVRHGDGDRCATREEMQPPQVRLVTRANMRSGPGFDNPVAATIPKGTCVAVESCATERGDLWCRIRWEGGRGYVVQIAPDTADPRSRILIFKNGCDGA